MGVAIPQIITEDRASGALVVDGSLRFDSSKSQYLSRTPSSSGNQTTWTWSGWIKRTKTGEQGRIFNVGSSSGSPVQTAVYFTTSDTLQIEQYQGSGTNYYYATSSAVYRDTSSWMHIVAVWDTNNSTSTDTLRLYVNGQRITSLSASAFPTSGFAGQINTTNTHYLGAASNGLAFTGQLTNVYFIDGQALDPSYFGYTDALTNTWRPKKLSSSVAFGTNGFYLPFDGSAPIGQDQSGRGNDWTPVNFGGSNTLEKATGALPILNTDGGGKVARVGVRTDSSASSLVLALPLVGIKSDFSNAINSGSSNKNVVNTTAVSFGSTVGNFYGGSAYFNGSHRLECDFSQSWTSNFTIEGWIYRSATGSYPTIFDFAATAGGYSIYSFIDTASSSVLKAQFYSSNSGGSVFGALTGTAISVDSGWHHFAVVRSGTTYSLYQNGVLTSSSTSSSSPVASTTLNIGNRSDETPTNPWYGYIQDFRVYVGVAKYTQNFIPASTDPDIIPDSPSGVSYSSNVALVPSTDGAVAFAGNSSTYLSLASSTDFNFGTGDFTIECFIYSTSSSDQRILHGSDPTYEFVATSSGLVFGLSGTFSTTLGGTFAINKWNHIALVRSGSTVTGYINGVACPTTHDIASNSVSYNSNGTLIGRNHLSAGTASFTTGFISNFHIVKGTALYTSNFTPPTGPISSVANTKLLCCKSNSSATTFDVSPGTITANGDAAATNFNPFTVNINTQRGKQSGWCTLNPLQSSGTLSNGNNSFASAGANWYASVSTIFNSSGKWYCEYFISSAAGPVGSIHIGIVAVGYPFAAGNYIGNTSTSYAYRGDGSKYINTLNSPYGTSFTTGDLIGVAFDAAAGTLTFYKNGISQGVATTGISGTYAMAVSCNGGNGVNSVDANFGQKPFKFPPPAGFQPLALANTPRPTIVRPDQFVGVTTYTGNGVNAPNALTVTGTNFKPDFIWIKARGGAYDNHIQDSVRGTGVFLQSNTTTAEQITGGGDISSFNSNGFTLSYSNTRTNTTTSYVAWAWKAGGNSNTYNINDVGYATASAAGLTAGTITPTGASVNTKSGFSIITYTGTNANATISHGLGNVPAFIIAKSRDTSSWNWIVYHKDIGVSDYLTLESTQGSDTRFANIWGSGHTTSVFGVRTGYSNNPNGERMVAYCWAEIPGFSKFGSYTGNASTDGPVVITGFRPKWILIKKFSATGNVRGWILVDSERSKYNVSNLTLFPHANAAEDAGTYISVDFLSNGFKLRSTEEAANQAYTYIYAAFAETPTQNLYGGQSNAR
jgi:hypothetical protein